mgnify:CR=1 FL=1
MNSFIFYAEPRSILRRKAKVGKRRVQNKMNLFIFYAEPQSILRRKAKVSKRRVQNKMSSVIFMPCRNLFCARRVK